MGKADKAQQYLGPNANPRPTLTAGHQRPYHSNPAAPGVISGGPLSDAVQAHNNAAAIGQAHVTQQSPVPGVSGIDSPAHLAYQPPLAPERAAHMTLQVPECHRGNALYTDANGQPPTVVLQTMRASHAANSFPGDVSASPAGAHGVGGFHGDIQPALHETPQGAPGAVHHLEREPGELQGYSPNVDAPGASFAARAPGDATGPGGGCGGRR